MSKHTIASFEEALDSMRPMLVVETTPPDDKFADCFIGYCPTHGKLNQTQGGFIFIVGFTNADASIKVPLPESVGSHYLFSNGLHCAECLSALYLEPPKQQGERQA